MVDVYVSPDDKPAEGDPKDKTRRISKKSPQIELEPVLSTVVEEAGYLKEMDDRLDLIEESLFALDVLLEKANGDFVVYHRDTGKVVSRHPDNRSAFQKMNAVNGHNDFQKGPHLIRPAEDGDPESFEAEPSQEAKAADDLIKKDKKPKKKAKPDRPGAASIAGFIIKHAASGKKAKLTNDTHQAYHSAHKVASIIHKALFAHPSR